MKLPLRINGAETELELSGLRRAGRGDHVATERTTCPACQRFGWAPRSVESRNGVTCRFRLGGGAEREADIAQPEPGVYSVLLNGRSLEARVEASEAGVVVVIGGRRFEIEVRDPRRWRRKGGGAGMEGRQNVTAPMPGKVVRLLVADGDAVQAGQGIAVVEAMKMQNEMKAPKPGRVTRLAVREGDTVAAGAVLAVIE